MTPERALHQFVAALAYGDAVGNHVLTLRRILRGCSLESAVFYGSAESRMQAEGWLFGDYDAHRGRPDAGQVLYHVSIGTPVGDFLAARDEEVLVDYHDFTPPEYFNVYDPLAAELVEQGQWQLEALAERSPLAWAHSEFARADLEKAGYANTLVLPYLTDLSAFNEPPDPETLRSIRETKGPGPDVVFVGRVAPNKRHDDLIKLVRLYREVAGRPLRLFCVGDISDRLARYGDELRSFTRELGVEDSVVFTGSVTQAQLRAYYAACDVFVSMSEHEGFGVPLVEAMYMGLPVVAYGAAAVPETAGAGALVLPRKDLVEFAVAIDLLFSDEDARETLRRAGKRRAVDFALQPATQRYVDKLCPH